MIAEEKLTRAALEARQNAVAPYSHFLVGAAVETDSGEIFTGCNVENATYGLTVCAERVALWKALSEGHRRFVKVAVVAQSSEPTPPCGACRQLLWEYGGDLEVILGDLTRETGRYRPQELPPHPFEARIFLDGK